SISRDKEYSCHIMCVTHSNLIRFIFDLCSKSPNIIHPDADLSRAIPCAMSGIMMNQGEVCSAGSRLFVQKNSFDNVMSELVEHAKKIKQGQGMDEQTQMGPLRSREQHKRVA